MIGLVCMFDGKGMKKGSNTIKNIDENKLKIAAIFNLEYTLECIKFCIKNKYMYRMSSSIIPYSDFWDWESKEEIIELFKKIKELSSEVRLLLHPDQYVVLNSDSESVIKNSLKILQQQSRMAKLAGVESLILHIGKKNATEKFKKTFEKIDEYTKSILVLENCHYYKVDEILKICQEIELPMVLDVHHARITKSETYDIDSIKKTWGNRRPLAHISSGKEKIDDKSHADYISEDDCKKFLWLFKEFDVEIEAKKKEKALFEVRKYLEKNKIFD